MEIIDRSDLRLLLAIRDHLSLSAAAVSLDVTPPVVTKRLAGLEARLGLRLFLRSTRRVTPTAEAEALFDRASRLLADFHELESEARERQAEPSGLLRLASTFGFGRLWVGPALAEFQAMHPRLRCDLQLTEALPDLATGDLDGAVWLWSVQGPRAAQWSGRRLARNLRVLAAAPAYLHQHGTPETPHDLAQHECLVVRENDRQFDMWALRHDREREVSQLRIGGPLSSNSGELVRDWCLAGRGIMLRSLWDIAPHLASGALVRVLPQYAMHDADIHWLAPWRPRAPRRVRLLVDFLSKRFSTEPWKPGASPATPPPQ